MNEALEVVKLVRMVEAVRDFETMAYDANLAEHMGYRWHHHS